MNISPRPIAGFSRPLRNISMVLLALCFLLAPRVQAQQVVEFSDPGLESAIRDAIGQPEGDVLDSDLANLAYLYRTS